MNEHEHLGNSFSRERLASLAEACSEAADDPSRIERVPFDLVASALETLCRERDGLLALVRTVNAPSPITMEEFAAIVRMVRLHELKEIFYNPIVAIETKRIARVALAKLEAASRQQEGHRP